MLRFVPEIRTTTPFFVGIPGAESPEVVYVGTYDTVPGQKGPEGIESDEQAAESILLSDDTIRTKEGEDLVSLTETITLSYLLNEDPNLVFGYLVEGQAQLGI